MVEDEGYLNKLPTGARRVEILDIYTRFSPSAQLVDIDALPSQVKPRIIVLGYKDRPRIIVADDFWCSYRPLFDVVEMPTMSLWGNSDWFYGFLFHELIHSTRHPRRLGRYQVANQDRSPGVERGDVRRTLCDAMDELTAWIGMKILLEDSGIVNTVMNVEIADSTCEWTEKVVHLGGSLAAAAASAADAVYYINAQSRSKSEEQRDD